MSCLIDAPSGFCASEMFSRSAQKALAWPMLSAIAASPARPFVDALREDRLDQPARILRRTARRDLDQHVPRPVAGKRRRSILGELQREIERRLADQLEGGEVAAGKLASPARTAQSAASGDETPAQPTSRPRGFGKIFSTAAVMMPSVPSAPTKRFFRS